MLTLIFNLIALFIILFIVWWFWFAKAKTKVSQEENIEILVKDGVYDPSRITIPSGKNVSLIFIRKDHSPCSEYVIFETLDIHQQLPIDKAFPIKLEPLQAGNYKFSCQMGMYQGELIVKA